MNIITEFRQFCESKGDETFEFFIPSQCALGQFGAFREGIPCNGDTTNYWRNGKDFTKVTVIENCIPGFVSGCEGSFRELARRLRELEAQS